MSFIFLKQLLEIIFLTTMLKLTTTLSYHTTAFLLDYLIGGILVLIFNFDVCHHIFHFHHQKIQKMSKRSRLRTVVDKKVSHH
jgi:hypothetical protein